MQKLGFLSKNHGSQEYLRVVAAPNAFGADRGKSVAISRRGRGQRTRLQYQSRLHQSQITSHRSLGNHGVIVGRLCQTPLSGQSIGVSQKRPTISLLTGADVAMDAVLVLDCLWVGA